MSLQLTCNDVIIFRFNFLLSQFLFFAFHRVHTPTIDLHEVHCTNVETRERPSRTARTASTHRREAVLGMRKGSYRSPNFAEQLYRTTLSDSIPLITNRLKNTRFWLELKATDRSTDFSERMKMQNKFIS